MRIFRQDGPVTTDRSRVLVVGDLNPDLILVGDVAPRFGQAEQLLDAAELVIGGSAGIAAHGLARLARPVSLVAAVGDDLFGTEVCSRLAAAGVAVDQVLRRPGSATGLSVVLSSGDDRAILTLPGAIPTLTADEVLGSLHRLAGSGLSHVHVCSLFLQPGLLKQMRSVLQEAHGLGLTTSLDTNGDPAGAWRGVHELLPLLDVVFPNRAEVIALGSDDDPYVAAAQLAERGPLVVVKNGALGGFAVTPSGERLEVPGEPVAAVDATGAGDSFDAAFLDGWLDDLALAECVRRAVLAGGLSVRALGGTAGQAGRADLMTAGKGS
jgi:sugar/nucleoside kinase (ribokinase family)